jgi:hypothetical protein
MHDEFDHLDQLTEADERALQIANLRYALATHIPAMKRRVHIQKIALRGD